MRFRLCVPKHTRRHCKEIGENDSKMMGKFTQEYCECYLSTLCTMYMHKISCFTYEVFSSSFKLCRLVQQHTIELAGVRYRSEFFHLFITFLYYCLGTELSVLLAYLLLYIQKRKWGLQLTFNNLLPAKSDIQ